MTLEQRLAAVEAELANMKSQQLATEELSKLMREACISSIKSAQRPGGMLHSSDSGKAAKLQAAEFRINEAISYEGKRDKSLDLASTLMRDSQHLSHL